MPARSVCLVTLSLSDERTWTLQAPAILHRLLPGHTILFNLRFGCSGRVVVSCLCARCGRLFFALFSPFFVASPPIGNRLEYRIADW